MQVQKSEIVSKLRKIKGIALKRTTTATAGGVLLRGNELYATDLKIAIRASLNAENDDKIFIIPPKAIELIENLPSEAIEITGDNQYINIKCGRIKNKYQTIPADSYPMMNTSGNNGNVITIESEELQDGLSSVLYAVSESSLKVFMQGVLLEAKGGLLNIVGCDGCRMAWYKVKYDGDFKVIVPKETIKEIISIGISGNVSLSWNEKNITFKTDEYEITSRVLDGEYLEYQKFIMEYSNGSVVNRKAIAECIKRTLICVDEKAPSKNKAIKCSFCENHMRVNVNQQSTEYEETVTLDEYVSSPLDIGFNGRFLLEALNSFSSDKISVKLGTSTQAVIFENEKQVALVLPVRL